MVKQLHREEALKIVIDLCQAHYQVLLMIYLILMVKNVIIGSNMLDLEITTFRRNFGEYHNLYMQSDALLLADVFKNFTNMCVKVYELDPAHFLTPPGLAWQACLKKTNVKLELLTCVDMFLMVEEGIRGGMCHAIHRYAKANNKYMKNYAKDNESSYI